MKIVVVSPHLDDETLGAGGFLLKRKSLGDEIYWINVTNISTDYGYSREYVDSKEKQISAVNTFFSFEKSFDFQLKPCSLETLDKNTLIEKFDTCFKDIQPNWLVLPNPSDAHSDHKIVFEAAMACSKVFRYPYIKKIMTMEILSETDFSKTGETFSPNYFVDITDFMGQKLEALKIYDTEIGTHPFPRSLESVTALATLRGAASGVKYAESFKMIKAID